MAVSCVETWDAIHAQHGDEREWYVDAEAVCDYCKAELLFVEGDGEADGAPPKRVWHFGCGTSVLGVLLAEANCDVLNTDASRLAIDQMARARPEGRWAVDDARDARGRGPFDLVVDKGAFDSITASAATRGDAARRVVASIHASLAPGAAWACFSGFAPHEKDTRLLIESGADWESVDCDPFGASPFELPDQECGYVYVCRRR